MSDMDDAPITLGGGAAVRESKVTDWVMPNVGLVPLGVELARTGSDGAFNHRVEGLPEITAQLTRLCDALEAIVRVFNAKPEEGSKP